MKNIREDVMERLLTGICTCMMAFIVVNVGMFLAVVLLKIFSFYYKLF